MIELRHTLICVQRAARLAMGELALPRLFKVILDIGNLLNRNRKWIGVTSGYCLRSILELDEIESTEHDTTLLQYIIQQVLNQKPDLFRCSPSFRKALGHVLTANLTDVGATLTRLTQEQEQASQLALQVENKGAKDVFSYRTQTRWDQIAREVEETQLAYSATAADARTVLSYFGLRAEVVGESIGQFFSFLHRLLSLLDVPHTIGQPREVPYVAISMDDYYYFLDDLHRTKAEQAKPLPSSLASPRSLTSQSSDPSLTSPPSSERSS